MSSRTCKECQQLYDLYERAQFVSKDRDEIAKIVGYGVIDGLMRFHSRHATSNERASVEVSSVYRSIDNVIRSCKMGNTTYRTIRRVEDKIEDIHTTVKEGRNINSGGSALLELVLKEGMLQNNSYQDTIIRIGTFLLDTIEKKGYFKNSNDSRTQDYQTIQESLLKKGY